MKTKKTKKAKKTAAPTASAPTSKIDPTVSRERDHSGGSRPDRSFVRRMTIETRMAVEKALSLGETGTSIAKRMGFPLSTWVSAVKTNPWPGGVLDPSARRATFEGVWLDEHGCIVPFLGLAKDGTPVLSDDACKFAGRRANVAVLRPKEQGAKAKPEASVPLVPVPETVLRDNLHKPPEAPEMPGMEEEGAEDSDLGTTRRRPRLSKTERRLVRARAYSAKALSLEDRITLLAQCARDSDADWRTRMAAIKELNEIDGLHMAAKTFGSGDLGDNASLFSLPSGGAVGIMPVGAVDLGAKDEDSSR